MLNSICAFYGKLLENEINKPTPDREKISKYLDFIKENCHSAPYQKGDIPEHLKPYLIKKGECSGITGTTFYKGKVIPKVAACIAEKRKKT
jgi:hypothetical protein